MKKLRQYLPTLFRSTAMKETPVFKTRRDVAAANNNEIVLPDFNNWEDAAKLYNTLLFTVPTQAMADMAFDDYYPAFFFALKRLENARKAGVSEDNKLRVHYSNFENLPTQAYKSGQYSVIEDFYELQEKLKATIEVDEQSGDGSVDKVAFMQAIYDHLDILVAMRNALYVPIKNVPEIKDTALAPEDSPLRADIVTDRYGSAYSGEYLDQLLDFIQWAEENAPDYAFGKLDQDRARSDSSLGLIQPMK